MHSPQKISNLLVTWYKKNARDLPWRNTTDPYKIWLSEIILQQTTVSQGTSYYNKITELYPTVFDLANAHIDDVLKAWQGLGYYSRARNLHFTANHIVNNYNGVFPNNYKELIKLKGVGPYTAAAIASFCFKENKVVVDGNVIRVISRLYGIKDAVDDRQTLLQINKLAQELCDAQKPEVFNQAIMEFGALQCKAKNPNCSKCKLSKSCKAFQNNSTGSIPYKAKRIKKKKRFFQYFFFIIESEKTLVQKRTNKDIWQGLYQFPLIETHNIDTDNKKILPISLKVEEHLTSKIFIQQLTHQTIHAQFNKVYISKNSYQRLIKKELFDECELISVENLNNYAWPRIIDLYLNDLSITLF